MKTRDTESIAFPDDACLVRWARRPGGRRTRMWVAPTTTNKERRDRVYCTTFDRVYHTPKTLDHFENTASIEPPIKRLSRHHIMLWKNALCQTLLGFVVSHRDQL